MARYKVLKSVAHSIGHSFTSTLNWWGTDYAMGHLLRRGREVNEPSLLVDLLNGAAGPASLCIPPVLGAVQRYTEWLPSMVKRHGSDMAFVRAAAMTVTFDLGTQRQSRYGPGLESPYVCRVEITDDRGRVWAAELRDWWVPEPQEPQPPLVGRRPWWQFWKAN